MVYILDTENDELFYFNNKIQQKRRYLRKNFELYKGKNKFNSFGGYDEEKVYLFTSSGL